MSLFGTGRKEGVLCVVVLTAVALLCHWLASTTWFQRPADPAPYLTTESATNCAEFLPAMAAMAHNRERGASLLWNDDARFGEPSWLSGAALLYPPWWLLLLDQGPWLLALLCWLHSSLACAGTYRFLRAIGVTRYVAFLGGASFGLGFYFTAQLDRLPEAAAAALVPFALEQTWRVLVVRERDRHGGLLGLTLALPFLSGGTCAATFGTLLAAGLFFSSLLLLERSELAHAFRTLGIAALVALLLTAPLWTSAVEHQGQLAAQTPPERHLQLQGLLHGLTPEFSGPLADRAPAAVRDLDPGADPLELVLFPGTLVLFLLLFAWTRPKRSAHSLVWVVAGAVGWLLTLQSPITAWLEDATRWAPYLRGSSLLLSHLSAVVIASLTLDNFFAAPTRRRYGIHFVGATATGLLLFAAVAGWWQPTWGGALLRWLGSHGEPAELARAARHLALGVLPTLLGLIGLAALFLCWRVLGILRFKAALAVLTLLCIAVPLVRSAQRPTRCLLPDLTPIASATRAAVLQRHAGSQAHCHVRPGARMLTTQGAGILAGTADYLRAIDSTAVTTGEHPRVLPLLLAEQLQHPLLRAAAVGRGLLPIQGRLHEWQSEAAMPLAEGSPPHGRLRLAFQTIAAPNAATAMARLLARTERSPSTDQVVIEGMPENFDCRPGASPTITALIDRPGELECRVDVGTGQGFLIVADAFAPGWKATLDGAPTRILRADTAFRAVAVPPGVHVIRMEYRPLVYSLGLPLLGLGIAMAASWLLLAWLGIVHPRRY